MKLSKLALAIGVVFSTALVGCGGDDNNSDSTTETVSYEVTAIDGYLRGVSVWLDINGNYQLDDGEPSAVTGEGGIASLNVAGISGDPTDYNVVVQTVVGQTIDEDTITPSNPNGTTVGSAYLMSAPAGETDITPLSTIVNLYLEQNTSDTSTEEQIAQATEDAIAAVAGQLGIEKDEVLGDYLEDGDDSAAYAAQNIVESSVLENAGETFTALSDSTSTVDTDVLAHLIEAVSSEIKTVVEAVEADSSGNTTFESEDIDFSSIDFSSDTDGDGVPDSIDDLPDDGSEWVDTDSDGTGNNADTDDDDDGTPDISDAFPLEDSEDTDTDGDGTGNNADTDDDNDGTPDISDDLPLDDTETTDTDGDGTGNNADTDDDDDGTPDISDAFPLDDSEDTDTDGDGTGNNADTDDDNDGTPDISDDFPEDDTETTDSDGDGVGDETDNCVNTVNADQADTDNDGIGDVCDATDGTSTGAVWDQTNWNDSNWQ